MNKNSIEEIYFKIFEKYSSKDENQEMHIAIETKYDSFDVSPLDFHLIEEDGFVQINQYRNSIKLYFEDIVSIDYYFCKIF